MLPTPTDTATDPRLRHAWVFDVLEDIAAYAAANGLPVTEAQIARAARALQSDILGALGLKPL